MTTEDLKAGLGMSIPSEDVKDILVDILGSFELILADKDPLLLETGEELELENPRTAAGLKLQFAENLFIGKEEDRTGTVVTIFDTPVRGPDFDFDGANGYEFHDIQIRVKSPSYYGHEGAWNVSEAIKQVLHGMLNRVENGARYTQITCTISPNLFDWSKDRDVRFVTSYALERQLELGTGT